ncbi:MAG: hypothetical protein AAB508_04655, partial [Patescibacteria group bacterium]
DVALIPLGAILTPHHGEFETLFQKELHSGRNIFDPLLPATRFARSGQALKTEQTRVYPGRS